jgi:hypothetical protein
MARSGWAALAVTVLLVAGLGSEAALDATLDADSKMAPLLDALTRFPAWSVSALGFESDMYGPIALKVLVLLALVFLLARGAGRSGRSSAAFLAGWGALMLSAAAAGVAYVVSADMLVLDGQLADSGGGAAAVVVDGLNSGVVFGLYTGWLVGLAVVVTARRAVVEHEADWDEVAEERSVRMPSLAPAAPMPAVGAGMPAAAAAAPVRRPAGAGASASAAAARGDSLGGMTLVPGMASVSPTGAPTPWANNPAQPPTRQPEPTTSGAWSAPPAAPATGSGEPFIPAGTWPAGSPQPEPDANSGSFLPPGAWPPTPRPETPATGAPVTNDWPNGGGTVPPAGYEQPEYSGLAPSTPEAPAPASGPGPGPGRLPSRGPSQAVTGQMPAASQPSAAGQAAGGFRVPGAGAVPGAAPPSGVRQVPPSSRQRPGSGASPAQGQVQPQAERPQGPQGPMLQGSGPTSEPVTPPRVLWPSKWPASSGAGATNGNAEVDPLDEGKADPDTRFW